MGKWLEKPPDEKGAVVSRTRTTFSEAPTEVTLGSLTNTACSCPIFVSIVSLVIDRLGAAGKPVSGFLNPFLYSTTMSVLNDIIACSNPVWGSKDFLHRWNGTPWVYLRAVVDHALTFMTTGYWSGRTELGASVVRCQVVIFGPADMSSGRICDRFYIRSDKITAESASDRMYTASNFSIIICSLSRRLALQCIICCALHRLHSL
jgi:hypothetical protein